MIPRQRSLLRLSGFKPEDAPETKSKKLEAKSLFRRFFHLIEQRVRDRDGRHDPHTGSHGGDRHGR